MAVARSITGQTYVVLDPIAIRELTEGPEVIRDLIVRAERVKSEAIRIAPRVTGNLASHIVKRLVKNDEGAPAVLVGVEGVPYAIWVHEGAAPHSIDAVNAPFLVFTGRDGGLVFTKHVDHPGNKPNRFLVRALSAAG